MTEPASPPENPKAKKFSGRFQILIGLMILLAATYSAAWFYGALLIKTNAAEILSGTVSPEGEASCADLGVSGFPFRFDITCTALTLVEADVTVKIPELKATVLVYRPTHLLWFAEGPATYEDAFSGTRREVAWDSMRGSARSNGWALARVSVEANQVTLSDTLVGTTELGRIASLQAHALDSPEKHDASTGLSEIAIFVGAEGGDLQELTIADGWLRLEAEVPGVPDDFRQWSLPVLVQNWQVDPVRLVGLRAEDSQSAVDITGSIGTTADANLTGDFDLTTTNVYEPLSAFIAPVLLDAYLGQRNDDGTYYRSYSIRDGVLFAGNLPVMQLAPLL